jgi:hypothetical protein
MEYMTKEQAEELIRIKREELALFHRVDEDAKRKNELFKAGACGAVLGAVYCLLFRNW